MKAVNGFLLTILIAIVIAACKEQVDMSARYVMKEETAYSYLSKHEQYSDYVELLNKVPVSRISAQ